MYADLTAVQVTKEREEGASDGSESDGSGVDEPEVELKPNYQNYPKAHLGQHFPHHVRKFGVTAGYNTKTFEYMHGSLKDKYASSNFKDVAKQVCITHHHRTRYPQAGF